MRKRKNKSVRRLVRRSPYERSLEHATNRLDKAMVEREACAVKLADLDREIPYLQGVIRALTPPQTMAEIGKRLVTAARVAPMNPPAIDPPNQQDAFLSRFVKPLEIAAVGGAVVNPGVSLEDNPFAADEVVEEIR